jgi:hypothetical protein
MSIRIRHLAIAAIAAAAVAIPGTALAGVTPSPSVPTVAPNFGYNPPTPTPRLQFRDWQFDVQRSHIAAIVVNNVEGQGAIPMLNWLNTQNGQFRDTFALGLNSVTIRHQPLPFPTVDLTTCTVEFNQVSPFRIVAGTGTALGAVSRNGLLRLQEMISYPYVQRHGYGYGQRARMVCPLRNVSVFAILFAIRNNLPVPGLPAPTLTSAAVQGHALVAVPRAVVPPTPYPTHSTYAPVVSGSRT